MMLPGVYGCPKLARIVVREKAEAARIYNLGERSVASIKAFRMTY